MQTINNSRIKINQFANHDRLKVVRTDRLSHRLWISLESAIIQKQKSNRNNNIKRICTQ